MTGVTPDKRADILNSINRLLEKKRYGYVVCGYDDREDDANMFFVILEKDGDNHG